MVAMLCGCTAGSAGNGGASASASGTPSATTAMPAEFGTVRFAIVAEPSRRSDVWVQVSDEGNQPAWITLMRGTDRIWINERCELADCGQEPAVCGAGIAMVRNIGGDASERAIELTWDGMTSVRTSAGCETRERVQADPGALTARICWAARADRQGGGGPLMGPGRVSSATCTERQVTSRDTAIVVRVP
jgi:hypothetical protein